jgi:hypothetical protein
MAGLDPAIHALPAAAMGNKFHRLLNRTEYSKSFLRRTRVGTFF